MTTVDILGAAVRAADRQCRSQRRFATVAAVIIASLVFLGLQQVRSRVFAVPTAFVVDVRGGTAEQARKTADAILAELARRHMHAAGSSRAVHLEVTVKLGPLENSPENVKARHIEILWRVWDESGRRRGTIHQANWIPEAYDGWDLVVSHALPSAVGGIRTLIGEAR